MKIVDTHCHLFDMKNYTLPAHIYPVIIGYSHNSNKKAAEIAEENNYPYALGIAPQTVLKEGEKDIPEWIKFIKTKKPNAIGEIGLDYKWAQKKSDVEKQMNLFLKMLDLADDLSLPLVIHSRNNPNENEVPKNAVEDILKYIGNRKFLMHFYSSDEETAKKIVKQGGYISITHLHSKERRKVINTVPIDKLVVESDCPFVGRNPEVVLEAIEYICEVKELSMDEVISSTTKNAMEFFDFRCE